MGNGAAPPLPGNERTQVNFRMDESLRQSFKRECARTGKDQNAVLEMLVEMWLAPGDRRGHHHLDGTVCPMSAMIDSLTEAIRSNVDRNWPR